MWSPELSGSAPSLCVKAVTASRTLKSNHHISRADDLTWFKKDTEIIKNLKIGRGEA